MTELNNTEMAQIDGGLIWIPIIIGASLLLSQCSAE